MRLMVMAAERAATMATMIHRIWRQEGQPRGGWWVARAARSAPVSAKGRAKTECSNLIISSTVRMRFIEVGESRFGFLRGGVPGPAVHFFLRQADLREDAADILRDEVVDVFRLMIEGRNRGHDDRASLLGAEHIFKMDAIEWRLANAQHELAAFFEHHVGGASDQIVAGAGGDGRQRSHGAGNYEHGVHFVAAGGDGSADIFVGQDFNLRGGPAQKTAGQLL